MSTDPPSESNAARTPEGGPPLPLTAGGKIFRMAVVGVIVAGVGVAFAFTGRWLSPHTVTPTRIVDTFEKINGPHEGFRRNHAKGVCVSGFFEANGAGEKYSKSAVFKPGKTPVVGRFALAGGMPRVDDTIANVRSMALRFALSTGEEWRMGINNIPVFIVKDGVAFHEQMLATAPDPATGKPDPAKIGAFMATHPEMLRAIGAIKAQTPTSGFEDSQYNSLNAFIFIDAAGHETPVRWSMVPLTPAQPPATQPSGDKNFLFDQLIARVKQQPRQWKLILTIGQPGDPTNDSTVMWPADREKVDVGTLTLDAVESEETSVAGNINFDPLILPDGIKGSDDPILSARSAAYSQSFTRRIGEPATQSAVTPAEVQKVEAKQ